MSECWNFHGFIAIPLEQKVNENLKNSEFNADSIECGNFVRAMYAILDCFKIENWDFINLCSDYLDKPASKIPSNKAKEMFESFCKLIDGQYKI